MKIYDFPYAPNPRKARIYLSEKDIDMDFVIVDIRQNEQAFSLLDAMMAENLFVAGGFPKYCRLYSDSCFRAW
jgi:glutathione S-transferase